MKQLSNLTVNIKLRSGKGRSLGSVFQALLANQDFLSLTQTCITFPTQEFLQLPRSDIGRLNKGGRHWS